MEKWIYVIFFLEVVQIRVKLDQRPQVFRFLVEAVEEEFFDETADRRFDVAVVDRRIVRIEDLMPC